jgi:hypothetical protein
MPILSNLRGTSIEFIFVKMQQQNLKYAYIVHARFGARLTCMSGSVISSAAIFLSSYASCIPTLIARQQYRRSFKIIYQILCIVKEII